MIGEGFRSGGLSGGQLGLGVREFGVGLFPGGFQPAGDQPVFRVDGVVAAFGYGGGVLDLFDLAAPLGQGGVVAVFELLGCLCRPRRYADQAAGAGGGARSRTPVFGIITARRGRPAPHRVAGSGRAECLAARSGLWLFP